MNLTESIEKARYASRYLELASKSARQADESLLETIAQTEQRIKGISFTGREAAALAGCDESTVSKHLKAGKLKSLLITDVVDWKKTHNPGWSK